MTDFTSDAPVVHRAHRPPRAEFYAYFTVIFLAALPLAFLAWALAALRQGTLTHKGPVARAWTQARIITPMIFSA
jgi:hypothetical protein